MNIRTRIRKRLESKGIDSLKEINSIIDQAENYVFGPEPTEEELGAMPAADQRAENNRRKLMARITDFGQEDSALTKKLWGYITMAVRRVLFERADRLRKIGQLFEF